MWKWIAVIYFIVLYTQCAKFGGDNSYTCHCINDEQCDKETGLCSGDCAKGWYGTTCQKQNVALGKSTKQVNFKEGRPPNLTVDGDRTRNIPNKCSDTGTDGTGRWWRVDLEEEYPIEHITIYYQSEPIWVLQSLIGFSIHVNKETQEPELCYKDETKERLGLPVVNDIECSQTITGRYVNISNFHDSPEARFLTLCEVEVYVCSVGTYGLDCKNFCHCLNNERCSETGQCPDGCADGWTGTTCNEKTCLNGFYGEGCQMNCGNRKCLNNSPCDYVRGECIGGCSDGYILTDCSTACDSDTYGAGCIKLCSDRNCLVETSSCNHINGNCQGGCKEGFSGSDCAKACDNGNYGAGCIQLCSDRNCLVETSCNHINGNCQGGCKEGFSGIDCLRCKDGVYGAGCSKKCSDRKCKDSNLQCDSKTGECIDGCQPGYQCIDCTLECDNGTYGQDCQFDCSARFCKTDKECSNIDGACDCIDGYQGTDCIVKQAIDTENKDHSSTIIGTILGLIFGFVAGVLVVIIHRRLKSKTNKSDKVTGNQLSNNITQPTTTVEQPVTQPSSNNQDNPYGELNTIYQNEHAYELLGKN